jgi:hypothetical protein
MITTVIHHHHHYELLQLVPVLNTSLQSAQDGVYNLICFALAPKIRGKNLSFSDDMIHCGVDTVCGILVSKVTEHQCSRSYRGKRVRDSLAFDVRSGAVHTAKYGNKKSVSSMEV